MIKLGNITQTEYTNEIDMDTATLRNEAKEIKMTEQLSDQLPPEWPIITKEDAKNNTQIFQDFCNMKLSCPFTLYCPCCQKEESTKDRCIMYYTGHMKLLYPPLYVFKCRMCDYESHVKVE